MMWARILLLACVCAIISMVAVGPDFEGPGIRNGRYHGFGGGTGPAATPSHPPALAGSVRAEVVPSAFSQKGRADRQSDRNGAAPKGGAVLAAVRPNKDAAKKELEEDMKAIQGTWSIVLIGRAGHAHRARGHKLRFEKEKLFINNGRPETFRLDPTKSPKHLDTINRDGEVNSLGIYMFHEGRLIICWSAVGGQTRPKRFETATDETRGFTLLWLERDKSAPEPREKDPVKEAIEEDMREMQGTWSVVDEEREGKIDPLAEGEVPPERRPKFLGEEIRFEKDKVFINGKPQTFKLDPSKRPKQIDFTDGAGRESLGIYKFEKDDLVISWNRPGEKQRPGRFRSTKEDKGITFLRLGFRRQFLDENPLLPQIVPEVQLPKEVQQDMKAMQGTWAVVYEESQGKPTAEERLKGLKIHFEKDTMTMNFENPGPQRFKLDPSQSPKHIDVIHVTGSKSFVGIYKFEKGLLVICWSQLTTEKARPSEFRSGGLHVTLLRFKPKK